MTDPQTLLLAQWDKSCAHFDVGVRTNIAAFVRTLDALTKALSGDNDNRSVVWSTPRPGLISTIEQRPTRVQSFLLGRSTQALARSRTYTTHLLGWR